MLPFPTAYRFIVIEISVVDAWSSYTTVPWTSPISHTNKLI